MLLDEVVKNSNYVTDEELTDINLVGLSNSAIAEVNSKCSTNLPLFVNENASETPYIAVSDFWVLRLIEPYLAYGIAANDTDTNSRDFHYNRFLQAVQDFKSNGLSSILDIDPETGEETGYAGDSTKMVKVDPSDVTIHWMGFI